MAMLINFPERAESQVKKLRDALPDSPRMQAFRLCLWSLEKCLWGNITAGMQKYRSRCAGPLKMAVLNTGGIGDTVINLNWIYQFFSRIGEPCRFDMYTNAPLPLMRSITAGWPLLRKVEDRSVKFPLRDYDAVFSVTSSAMVKILGVDEDRLKASPFALDFCRRLRAFQLENPDLFNRTNYQQVYRFAKFFGRHRWSQGDFDGSLGLENSAYPAACPMGREEIAGKFGLKGNFITVHRESGFKGKDTKLWPGENYAELLRRLHGDFAATHSMVLVGVEKNYEAPDLPGIADLRGKTSFDDLLALLKHAAFHVCSEGLTAHLRHFLGGGRSFVIYGPSDSAYFSYPENTAFHGAECPHGCEDVCPEWFSRCIKGHALCRSIGQVSVDEVHAAVRSAAGR